MVEISGTVIIKSGSTFLHHFLQDLEEVFFITAGHKGNEIAVPVGTVVEKFHSGFFPAAEQSINAIQSKIGGDKGEALIFCSFDLYFHRRLLGEVIDPCHDLHIRTDLHSLFIQFVTHIGITVGKAVAGKFLTFFHRISVKGFTIFAIAGLIIHYVRLGEIQPFGSTVLHPLGNDRIQKSGTGTAECHKQIFACISSNIA